MQNEVLPRFPKHLVGQKIHAQGLEIHPHGAKVLRFVMAVGTTK